MSEEPDFGHGCLGVLLVVFLVLFFITALADRDDFKNIQKWESYGIRVIRSQPSDLPALQDRAQELIEKDRK